MDQSGSFFEKIVGRSLRKRIGVTRNNLSQKTVRTKVDLNHVTVMPVILADGKAYTPVVVNPGATLITVAFMELYSHCIQY